MSRVFSKLQQNFFSQIAMFCAAGLSMSLALASVYELGIADWA